MLGILYIVAYYLSNRHTKELIIEDVKRNLKWEEIDIQKKETQKLRLCCKKRYFRNILCYRLKMGNFSSRVLAKLFWVISPGFSTIEIGGKIEGGLMISHSFCIIYVKSAGKNLRIGPGVIIGRSSSGFPTIGDNVYIAANSTVIGNVNIGNNVIIGAGSVVTKDIPSDSVVAGNPVRIIRNISETDYNEIM